MPNLIFTVLFTVVISFGALHAILMLVSPQTHRRFSLWLSTIGRHSKVRLDEQRSEKGLELSYRVAGFIGLATVAVFTWVLINGLIRSHGLLSPAPKGPTEPRPTWLPFVVGFAAIIGGVYCINRPEGLFRWTSKAALGLRDDKPFGIKGIRRGGLLMGLCLIGFGLFALVTGFIMLLH